MAKDLDDKQQDCSTTGGGGISSKNPSQKRKLIPIGPAVYVWLLVGVIFIVSKLFF